MPPRPPPAQTPSHGSAVGNRSFKRGQSGTATPAAVRAGRRSSFEVHASSDRQTSMRPLEARVLKAEEMRHQQEEESGVVLDDEARGDPLDPALRELLNLPPEERETDTVESLAESLSKLAPQFFGHVTDDQQTEIARCALYHFFEPGEEVCMEDDELCFFFVVLHGVVEVDETRVSHNEGTKGRDDAQMRTKRYTAGRGFHHYPLVMQSRFYGYNARIPADSHGASILLIQKGDYISTLRRSVDKEMTETVTMLKTTPFFASWSEASMNRLYFWFDRQKRGPEEDVVTQGDDADFCFIIKSGRCDVLVDAADEGGDESESTSAATSIEASPAFRRDQGAGTAEGQTGAEDGKAAKSFNKKRKQALKMAAAAAFKSGHGDQDLKLRANMRHVVTLRPGAIVGEIALFKDGVKRMATVRTADQTELLLLDKKSFLDLDKATLNVIAENARYNAACTKEPNMRTRDDLQILQQRTSHLSHLSALSSDVHLELCRVMRYRKVTENTLLVRKGMAARCLYVLISGTAGVYFIDPEPKKGKSRWANLQSMGGSPRKRDLTADAYVGVKPNDTIRAGQAIGEEELLQENPVFAFTAVTPEPAELMEIDRSDFDRILKADKTTERGQLIEFLNGLPMLEGTAVASIHALMNSVTKKAFVRDQLCLAHPPDQSLGSASFSSDCIYLVYSGEARLLCNVDPKDARPPPAIDPAGPAYGPAVNAPPPHNSRVERHVGSAVAPVAILGPGECITESLLPGAGSRWCLRPITQLEILVIPKKDWQDTLRLTTIADLRGIAADKAAFFKLHTERIIAQTAQMHQLRKSASKTNSKAASPRVKRASLSMADFATPVPRDAYAPIVAPTERPMPSPRGEGGLSLPPINSPRESPRSEGTPRRAGGDPAGTPRGSPGYSPAIRMGRSSAIAMRPLIAG